MQGKACLFPFGFHCTGMPIKVSYDIKVWPMATSQNTQASRLVDRVVAKSRTRCLNAFHRCCTPWSSCRFAQDELCFPVQFNSQPQWGNHRSLTYMHCISTLLLPSDGFEFCKSELFHGIFQACADKLQREIADFGCPPQFPKETQPAEEKQVMFCDILWYFV